MYVNIYIYIHTHTHTSYIDYIYYIHLLLLLLLLLLLYIIHTTGSIGVITEIPNVFERLQKEGIQFESITAGHRHWLNGYLDQRVPSSFLAGSFRNCLNCAVLKCTFPRRTR